MAVELRHFGQLYRHHRLARGQVFIELHRIRGEGKRRDAERQQTDIHAVQIIRELCVFHLSGEMHIRQRPETLTCSAFIGPDQQQQAIGEALRQLL